MRNNREDRLNRVAPDRAGWPPFLEDLFLGICDTLGEIGTPVGTVWRPSIEKPQSLLAPLLRRHLQSDFDPSSLILPVSVTPRDSRSLGSHDVDGQELTCTGTYEGRLSPWCNATLAPKETRIRVVCRQGSLCLGIGIPGQTEPISLSKVEGSLDLFWRPKPEHRLLRDRMQYRPWRVLGKERSGQDFMLVPIGPPLCETMGIEPFNLFPALKQAQQKIRKRLASQFFHIPLDALNAAAPFSLSPGETPMIWLQIEGDDFSREDADLLQEHLKLNVVPYSLRLPIKIEEGRWEDNVLILDEVGIDMPAGIQVLAVLDRDLGMIPEGRDQADPGGFCYRLDRGVARGTGFCKLFFPSSRKGKLQVWLARFPTHVEADHFGEVRLENPNFAQAQLIDRPFQDQPFEENDLWRKFADGVLSGGRCLTALDLELAVAAFETFNLNRLIDFAGLQIGQKVGRLNGGLLPYTSLRLPLRPKHGLSELDLEIAEKALQKHLQALIPVTTHLQVKLEAP